MSTGKACAKSILFGEHAVVYGQPALAIPVQSLEATAQIRSIDPPLTGKIRISAPQIALHGWLDQLDSQHPIALIIALGLEILEVDHFPGFEVQISSTIPIAAGMGSGAAISIAILRALAAHFKHQIPLEEQSRLAYEIDKIYHGTPSGIDNNVITYALPVLYSTSAGIQPFKPKERFELIIADTGIKTSTATAVGAVRQGWMADPQRYEGIFSEIGRLVESAHQALLSGEILSLGPLMDQNQALLEQIGVSSPDLENLITIARGAGAAGAKLSGGGMGGTIIALAEKTKLPDVLQALQKKGAATLICTEVVG
jgi:mevalonate kinase